MSRFLAVVHGWHVSSKGFDVHELEAGTMEQAQMEAAYIKDCRETTFDKCAYVVVEIDDREHLPRRLTWRERLAGKVMP